jgi:hypothetical protein
VLSEQGVPAGDGLAVRNLAVASVFWLIAQRESRPNETDAMDLVKLSEARDRMLSGEANDDDLVDVLAALPQLCELWGRLEFAGFELPLPAVAADDHDDETPARLVWTSLGTPTGAGRVRIVAVPRDAADEPRLVVERASTDALGRVAWTHVGDDEDEAEAFLQALTDLLVGA